MGVDAVGLDCMHDATAVIALQHGFNSRTRCVAAKYMHTDQSTACLFPPQNLCQLLCCTLAGSQGAIVMCIAKRVTMRGSSRERKHNIQRAQLGLTALFGTMISPAVLLLYRLGVELQGSISWQRNWPANQPTVSNSQIEELLILRWFWH